MPQHIVLPNGMWRFIKGKAKSIKSKIKRKRVVKRRRSTGGVKMARRGRKGRNYSGGGNKLSRGLIPVKGIFAQALIGAGAATLQEKFLPQVIPYQGEAIGFAVGGIGGAAGAFARKIAKGNIGSIGGNY